jgi:hypothetical protein
VGSEPHVERRRAAGGTPSRRPCQSVESPPSTALSGRAKPGAGCTPRGIGSDRLAARRAPCASSGRGPLRTRLQAASTPVVSRQPPARKARVARRRSAVGAAAAARGDTRHSPGARARTRPGCGGPPPAARRRAALGRPIRRPARSRRSRGRPPRTPIRLGPTEPGRRPRHATSQPAPAKPARRVSEQTQPPRQSESLIPRCAGTSAQPRPDCAAEAACQERGPAACPHPSGPRNATEAYLDGLDMAATAAELPNLPQDVIQVRLGAPRAAGAHAGPRGGPEGLAAPSSIDGDGAGAPLAP